MVASLISGSMDPAFFHTAAFGIVAMILVGSSWCLIGYIMGDAPKRNIDPALVQFFGSAISAVVSLGIIFATGGFPRCSWKILSLTCGSLALGAALNFFMLLIMSYAMQRGPNGVIWAIIQSALIFPFMGGIVFFHEAATWHRLAGLIMLLAALFLFALCKDNSTRSSGWKLPAFLCLAICAVQQNLTTAPAYFAEARAVNSIVRTFASSSGALIASILYLFCRTSAARNAVIGANLRNATLWKYIGGLQFFHLIFAYMLFHPGMNAMADHGLGGMCYPMMVGSCIVSFTLLSVLVLKERFRPIQSVGLALCILGLAMLCFQIRERPAPDRPTIPETPQTEESATTMTQHKISPTGAVCFTFDDYHGKSWLDALPLFRKYDAHATFFVVGEITPEKAEVMKQLKSAGHTVGLHTLHHRDAIPFLHEQGGEKYLEEEVLPQLEACRKHGLAIRSFAYPNNRRDDASDRLLAPYFDHLRAGRGSAEQTLYYYPLKTLPKKCYLCCGKGIGSYYDSDLAVLKDELTRAAKTGSVLVYFSHNIGPADRIGRVDMRIDWLETLLDHARELGLRIVGFDELNTLKYEEKQL